jgi:hypothetical protein
MSHEEKEFVPMMACFGGPLHGKDVPADEPDYETTSRLYQDLYYEQGIGFYQKVTSTRGDDVCHWYVALTYPDPEVANRALTAFTYRGVLPEDAADYTKFEMTADKLPDFSQTE